MITVGPPGQNLQRHQSCPWFYAGADKALPFCLSRGITSLCQLPSGSERPCKRTREPHLTWLDAWLRRAHSPEGRHLSFQTPSSLCPSLDQHRNITICTYSADKFQLSLKPLHTTLSRGSTPGQHLAEVRGIQPTGLFSLHFSLCCHTSVTPLLNSAKLH